MNVLRFLVSLYDVVVLPVRPSWQPCKLGCQVDHADTHLQGRTGEYRACSGAPDLGEQSLVG